ncbi:TetR/AcrR family transcriptional regulator [Haloflavibacter putidus]|uniref:TetR/AcrR family transcriptional regulator n=1 Tax=Haloflavibacter putidus TaxID=2576776 RepID=A0A507ZQA2_9FLAO|nr:TetR/AcrR family transcriptional regulator [Haloflavibacter putidus]TQD39750.1 TetR/AcrR family transcriptional regulator [Haloflavibacter putidus]
MKKFCKWRLNFLTKKAIKQLLVKDIATVAGTEAASLYNHIKNKQEILQVLLLAVAEKFNVAIDAISVKKIASKQKLKQIIEAHLEIAFEHRQSVHLILHDWKELEEEQKQTFLTLRNDYQNKFQKIIEDGIESGCLKNINPVLQLQHILSSLRWIYNPELYKKPVEINLEEYKETVLNLLFNGIF